jgi:hypothetical protein
VTESTRFSHDLYDYQSRNRNNGNGRSPLGSAVRFQLQARSLAFSIQLAQAIVPPESCCSDTDNLPIISVSLFSRGDQWTIQNHYKNEIIMKLLFI